MAEAKRDQNQITTLIGVSSSDGETPVVLWADPTTHRLLVSATAGDLDDLTNVVITSATQGDILYYDGDDWVNLGAGTSGQFLKTQGTGANPTWDNPIASAAGSDTQVQFNDGGTALGGDTGFTYNKTTNVATIGGILISGLTASELVATDATKNLVSLAVATYPSLTELSYVKGVTSGIQAQLNGKQSTLTNGIANTNNLVVDDADAADNDYAKFTASGLEGRSYSEVKQDLDLEIGTDIQAYSAKLSTIAGFTPESSLIIGDGLGDWTTVTSANFITNNNIITTSSKISALSATSSSELAGVISDETGSGSLVFATSPTLVTPALGTPTSGNLSNCSNYPTGTKTSEGALELATTSEIDTGTDTDRAIPVDQFVASKRNIRWLVFNLVGAGTDCAVATNIAGDFVSPIAGTILQSDTTPFYLYATNSTAGETGTMVVDISINNTSIMTTNKLDFDTAEKTTTTASTPPDLTTTSLSVGDIIRIDIDSIHTTAAKGLTVYMAIRE